MVGVDGGGGTPPVVAHATDEPAVADAPRPDGGDQKPSGPRLTHQPALDGLRGLAVAAVLLFHLRRLDGGFLGVDLFFVLSGFLITSLLVVEHQARGTIDLGRFWARRARRLLPALLLLVAGVSVLLLTLTPEDQRARFRGEALSTLGYVANWHRMSIDVGYWEIFEQPSPLDHTWSLAIEEQFYVAWPLLVVLALVAVPALWARRRRRGGHSDGDADGGDPRSLSEPVRRVLLGGLALAGAAVSFGLLAGRYSEIDTARAYFGTDTRLGATLLGAGLAVLVAGRARSPSPTRRSTPTAAGVTEPALPRFRIQRFQLQLGRGALAPELLGWAALAWLGWSVLTVDGLSAWYYQGGLVVFALAALAVIWAIDRGPTGPLARLLGWAPLRWLGLISYGVYLWHWPVNVYLTRDRLHVRPWLLDASRLAVTLAIAYASYRLLEQPIRRGALRGRALLAVTSGAVGVSLVAVLVATAGARAPETRAELGFDVVPVEGSDNPYLLYPWEIPPDATRLLIVGDSGAFHLGPVISEVGQDHGFAVASSAPYWCNAMNPEGLIRFPDGEIIDTGNCQDDRHEVLRMLMEEFRPQVVVYYMANVGGFGKVRIGDDWLLDCDPGFDDYLTEALQTDAELLTAHGAQLVLATSPEPPLTDERGPERTRCRNDTYRRVAASRPDDTTTVDMHGFVEQQRVAGDEDMFMDIVHLSDHGSRLVSGWLLPQLATLVGDDSSASPAAGG